MNKLSTNLRELLQKNAALTNTEVMQKTTPVKVCKHRTTNGFCNKSHRPCVLLNLSINK